jgi:hypothetical protein
MSHFSAISFEASVTKQRSRVIHHDKNKIKRGENFKNVFHIALQA